MIEPFQGRAAPAHDVIDPFQGRAALEHDVIDLLHGSAAPDPRARGSSLPREARERALPPQPRAVISSLA